jgi:hypothetical protein
MRANPDATTLLHHSEHAWVRACATYTCIEALPAIKGDAEPVGFNDPRAWGYCCFCAFDVATDVETGDMLPHDYRYTYSAASSVYINFGSRKCWGSYLSPTRPSPEVATRVTFEEYYRDDAAPSRDPAPQPD